MAKTRTTICLDDKVLANIKKQAEKLGMSVSAYLTMLANNEETKKI